ncbi:MAG: PolC-type DNA polymerase III [Bacilli bacterium]
MDNKLKRFLDLIHMEEEDRIPFFNAFVKKVDVNVKEKRWTIYINIDNLINVEVFKKLCFLSESIKDVEKVRFVFSFSNENNLILDYFHYIFDIYGESCPMLLTLKNNNITFNNNIINIEVLNKIEETKIMSLKSKFIKFLNNMGFKDVKIETTTNKEEQNIIKELIKQKDVISKDVSFNESTIIIGNEIKSKTSILKNIIGEDNDITVEAFIFGLEFKDTNSGYTIITLKISDYTDSLIAKVFTKESSIINSLKRRLEISKWYKFRGYVKYDKYLNDLVLNIRDVEALKKEKKHRTDSEEEKRVELHVHSIMSQMDGLVRPDKLLKKVKDFGHTAVGITDKNGIQIFPKLEKMAGDIKILYGVELFAVEDEVKIILRPTDEYIEDTEFVVFDLETTGLNAGGVDSIIEIGAVKIKNNEVIDRYDELIDPLHPLRDEIINITNITDDMLKGKDNEENAIKRFISWIGKDPLIAHNARFDVSFIESAFRKYGLGKLNNTVIDTMEISRVTSPSSRSHSLSSLVKRLKIDFDESTHHRADNDAEVTAKIFSKLLESVGSNYKKISDLNNLVEQTDIYKTNRPFHLTVFAKNDVGLKNMFKLITFANTTYFFKGPRIPKSVINKYREGLLIGSGCVNGEVFLKAKSSGDGELENVMEFYDFIEVNPPSIQTYLIETGDFSNMYEVKENIKKIITAADNIGKKVVATGDVHTLDPDDNIYREILITQKQPQGGFHPLYKPNIKTIPNAFFMNTREMLDEFSFLGEEKAKEIVVKNSNEIADSIDKLEIVKHQLFPPVMENSDGIIRDMVYKNARALYGEVLPENIETRLEKELNGIINGGYSVMYLIAQKLVEDSNNHGYMVGSRGSVGSSLVATFCNITEVNPLPPHYVCPNCHKSIFEENNELLSVKYGSGFDLPDKVCECGHEFIKQGQNIPFETFLGFNADKTPDIDLNFSGEYQANAHNYTKVLFGENNVFRAGTVTSIAEKTAYGFVKIYAEDKGITLRRPEIERLSLGIQGIKRTTGQHPGGIIVIPNYKEVFDFTPYQYPAENPDASWYTTHFEFHDIEENVLKLDILGHDDPTVIKYLCDDLDMKVEDIPLGDSGVIGLFNSPLALGVTKEEIGVSTGTLGIPEFGTNFVMNMLEEVKPNKYAELIKVSGLSHGTDVWYGNARDLILNKTCLFDEVIGCRDDIMLYLIDKGIDKGKSFKISEFIRKGKTHKLPDEWEEYKKILKEHDVPEWYIGSCEKIKYMFPKAHASAYVINSLRVAWFKLYHPLNYYRVFLSIRRSDFDIKAMINGKTALDEAIRNIESKGNEKTDKEDNVATTLYSAREMIARGFKFDNISITESDSVMFKINKTNDGLIPPFTTIEGLGESVAKKIVEERSIRAFVSIEDIQQRGKVGLTILDKMRTLGVLNGLPESSQLSLF